MTIECQLLEFTPDTDTGNDSSVELTGLDFTPMAAIVMCHEHDSSGVIGRGIRFSNGFSDAVNDACSGWYVNDGSNNARMELLDDACIAIHDGTGLNAGTPLAKATISAFGADFITLNWSINFVPSGGAASRVVRILVLGGDITNVAVGTEINENGTYPLSINVGFTPNACLFTGDQYGQHVNDPPWNANGGHGLSPNGSNHFGFCNDTPEEASAAWRERNNGRGTSNAVNVGLGFASSANNSCNPPNQIFLSDIVANGYRITQTAGMGANNDIRIAHMCLAGTFNTKVGSFASPATAPNTVSLGLGFAPVGGVFVGGQSNCPQEPGVDPNTQAKYGREPKAVISVFDSVNQSVYWAGNNGIVRASADSDTGIILHANAVDQVVPVVVQEVATRTIQASDLDVVFTQTVSRLWNTAFIVFGNTASITVKLPVLSAGTTLPRIKVTAELPAFEVWPMFEHTLKEPLTGNAYDAADQVRVDWTHSTHPAFTSYLYYDGRPAVGGEFNTILRLSFPKGATGLWTATFVDTGGSAPNLNGIVLKVQVAAQPSAVLNRGHLTSRAAQSRKFFAWMNAGLFNPQLVQMGGWAWENSPLVPPIREGPDFDGLPWPSFFDHTLDAVDTVRANNWIEEFVGTPPGSNHAFLGIYAHGYHAWRDGGKEGGGYGGGIPSGADPDGHFPNDDRDPSYQYFEVMEYFAKELYKIGCCLVIRHMGDETDGNEQNLPTGYNGAQAKRLQNQRIARICEIPSVAVDWAYDCWEFNGAPATPTGDYSLVQAVFDPFKTYFAVTRSHYRKLSQAAGEPNLIVMCRGYRGTSPVSCLHPISDSVEVVCYENQGPGWRTASGGGSLNFPASVGYQDMLDNDLDENGVSAGVFRAGFCADQWRIRASNDWTEDEIFETIVKSFLGGFIGGAMADLSLGLATPAKTFLDEANEGRAPSNLWDTPFVLANIFSFFHWDPLGTFGGQRYNLNMVPALTAWLFGYSQTPTNELGPVGAYDPTDKRKYLLAWVNSGDPQTDEILFDFSTTGANMVATTGGIAVNIDDPTYTEYPITVVPVQGAGLFTTIKLPSATAPVVGRWLVHIDPSYPLTATIQLPVLPATALLAIQVTLGNLTISLPVIPDEGALPAIDVTLGNLTIQLPVISPVPALPAIQVLLGLLVDLPVLSAATPLPAIKVTLADVVQLPLLSSDPLPAIQVLLTQTVFGSCSASATSSSACATPGVLLEGESTLTQLDIWNIAAVSLGIGEFGSVTENSLKRTRFDARWNSFKRKFFHDHKFRSTVTNRVLPEITNFDTARKGGWAKCFGFPADYIRALTVNDDETFQSSGRFEVLADPDLSRMLLLTNEATVTLKYIYNVTQYGLLSPSVAEALGLNFGLQFALKFGKSPPEIVLMTAAAKKALADANMVDGIEGSPDSFFPHELLDAMENDYEGPE